jgi:hypothetical protein
MSGNRTRLWKRAEVKDGFVRLSVASMQGTEAGSGHGCHGNSPWLLWGLFWGLIR